jgi:hypothetical protein
MGLLDDAIREHLELKRRHGADPSEVERQEQEALGPARRGAAPPAEAEPEAGAVSVGMLDADEEPEAPTPYDDEPDDEPADEPAPSVPAGEPEAPVAPPAPAPASAPEEPEPEAAADGEGAEVAEVVEEPAPERAAADDDAAAGEDVLEETPDFLQETPEHDRLWFEQKPPRDFEF